MHLVSTENQKILDFIQEKEKRKNRYACTECLKKGRYCPDWIIEIDDESFESLNLEKRLEWLYHTRDFA